MLRSLRLRDVVLVDQADVEFGPGFNVLTGESGAGKSILLDALGLALGHRAQAQWVREGCARADVSAEFASSAAIDDWLQAHELVGEPGTVWLRRVVETDGRSRAFINSQPVPATLLRELGEQLLDLHGQHAHQRLLRSAAQRELLDAYAGIEADVSRLQATWADWQRAEAELAQAQQAGSSIALEREQLSFQIEELEALKLGRDEWEHLEQEQKRLAHAAALIAGAQAAEAALQDDEQALKPVLSRLLSRLRALAAIDAGLAPALELLEGAAIQLGEAADAISHYAQRIDLDPQRLDEIDRRLGTLHQLARKYRVAPQELAPQLDVWREKRASLERASDCVALEEAAKNAQEQYQRAAQALCGARHEAAQRLAPAVAERITGLGMHGSRFLIAIEDCEPGPSGTERVEFQLAGHAGESPKPLAKVGSGGELSRVGLAITVAAARAQPVSTLVFDEADSGVGGAVAELIGRLMRRLGESHQVLCVTHLPQVAALAHHQFVVAKSTRDGRQTTAIRALSEAARIEEIARMLGGVELTETTREHAREMLERPT